MGKRKQRRKQAAKTLLNNNEQLVKQRRHARACDDGPDYTVDLENEEVARGDQ